MSRLLPLMLLLLSALSFAQKLELSGKIADKESKPVENATVYLLKKKDSSVINYTSSSSQGSFKLLLDALTEESELRIEADNYLPYSRKFDKINQSADLGLIRLVKDSAFSIEAVEITASPVRIKKDTIEFSTNAIKVRPDSKAEDLLKLIPGIEVDNDGKIRADGKEVDQIMVNGKPFFDQNGQIALKNLPAELIRKVQITTTKTEEEINRGKRSKSANATLNLSIDERKNKGMITRITAGVGTDKRYEASGFASYFNKDSRVSLLASSNNINSPGFSNDEIFDSMGHGRNSNLLQGNRFSVRGNNTTVWSGGMGSKGILRSSTLGVSYNDKLSKEVDLRNLSGMMVDNHQENRSKSSRTTFLPDYSLTTDSENSSENDSRQFSFENSYRMKPDSLTTVSFSPSFNATTARYESQSSATTYRDGLLLNESQSRNTTDSYNSGFNANLYINRRLKKKGRNVYGGASTNYSSSNSDNYLNSSTLFFQGSQPNDIRNQKIHNKNLGSYFSTNLGFEEPVSDSALISFDTKIEVDIDHNSRMANDFDQLTGQYNILNSLLSYENDRKVTSLVPEIGFELEKEKIEFDIDLGVRASKLDLNSHYNHQNYNVERNFWLPEYNMSFSYKFTDKKRLRIYNFSDFTIPQSSQLMPYEDLSNPLHTVTGNPELKPSWRNYLNVSFNDFDLTKKLTYFFNLGFTYQDNVITNYSYYDPSGRQFTTYLNIDGFKNVYISGSVTKNFKWGNKTFSLSPRVNLSHNFYRGFADTREYSSKSYSITPSLMLSYEIKDRLLLRPSYTHTSSLTHYENYRVAKMENSVNTAKLEMTNYFLDSNLFFGNDFQYSTNSNIAPGFKKDFYFWNTSVGYSFYKKQLTAKLKVYDVLNQNQSVSRIISSSYVEDREDLIMKRYIMFSLTLKLNKFPGQKETK